MISWFVLLDNREGTSKRMRYFLLVILITLLPNFSMGDEVTAEAQRLLNELGYNAGPVDGLIGELKAKDWRTPLLNPNTVRKRIFLVCFFLAVDELRKVR